MAFQSTYSRLTTLLTESRTEQDVARVIYLATGGFISRPSIIFDREGQIRKKETLEKRATNILTSVFKQSEQFVAEMLVYNRRVVEQKTSPKRKSGLLWKSHGWPYPTSAADARKRLMRSKMYDTNLYFRADGTIRDSVEEIVQNAVAKTQPDLEQIVERKATSL